MHSIYDWFRRHRFAVDFVLMSILFLLALPFSLTEAYYSPQPTGTLVQVVILTALVVPLAWRRTRTVMAGSIIAAAAIVQWAIGVTPTLADVAVPLIVYALAAFGPRWASLGGLGLALLGGVMLITRYFYDLTSLSLADLPYGVVMVIMVWVLVMFSWTAGDLTRTKRLREQALSDRAHRLEIEAQHERELAASDERAHIAREMHDIVAHSLSVIITQADGARYAAVASPEVAPETLATIAATGRASLQEMRRLLGVLRGGSEASTRPLPGLMDLDELLLGTRAAGLPIDYSVTGEARRQLPPGAELTAYRVVQEGLTNVMKHAGPNVTAAVNLSWSARGLDITVRDNGRGASASLATHPVPVVPAVKGPAPVPSPPAATAQHPHPGTSPDGTAAPSSGSVTMLSSPQAPPTQAPQSARVRDAAVPSEAGSGEAGGGNGLRGMAERVKLYDGSLLAGPLPGGGFGIAAFIPYTEQ